MNSLNNLLFHRITPGIFRLILALLVVLYHTIGFLPIGPFSVYVFFVLSGYWIFRMYVEKYSKFENPYATFVKSRLYRLMPVYLLILVISILIYLIVPELRGKFLDNVQASPRSIYNLFCLGLNFSNFRIIGPAWSLDVEIQFYMMAPLMLLLIGSKKKIAIVLLVIVVIFSFFTLSLYRSIPNTIFTYLPFFLIGGLIYKWKFNPSHKTSLQFLTLAGLILAINYLSPMLRNNFLDHHNAAIFGYKYSDFINIVLALLTIPYVANNVNQKYAVHMKHDALYASMSFIIYLLHWPMFKIYGVYTSNLNSVFYKSMSLITLYLLCLLFTWILSRYFDTSVDEGRRSWLKKQPLEATKKKLLNSSGRVA